ncbi:DUF4199 domain-containing protein [Geothrix sp. PMB-07]|uniref:DUF4199 domain-containing protein n=1 Tax=Geothrix sp. PMB-07 TaxID=3068640 RepID=UPI002741342C|nr:DUF4199 domain-containing protein [Geothrix sp. PMB-07]WLT32305.1 DUF4199 domain-containing protein [Geothrix sp. PMB-07]
MHPTLRAGLILGLSVAAWTFVMGFTGWYKNPSLLFLFWLVVPLQIGILVWALRGLAPVSGYGRQVWNGVSISLLASILIYWGSILFTTVVFPHYFQDIEALGRAMMAKQGLGAEQIEAAVKAGAAMQTPRASAMAGAIGTMVTGFLTSVVGAIWLRKK